MGEVSIEILTINQARQALPDLCALLIDSVEHGASVNFILPMSFEKASAFWTQRSFPGVAAQTTLLFVAKAQERLIGTVQIQFAPQKNSLIVQKSPKCWCIRRRGGAVLAGVFLWPQNQRPLRLAARFWCWTPKKAATRNAFTRAPVGA